MESHQGSAFRLRSVAGRFRREEHRCLRDDDMEALDMPAAAGGHNRYHCRDYSNGNDAVIVRQNLGLAQIPGKQVLLVEKTVSQYLFERAMAMERP